MLYGLAATRYIPADQLGDPTQITSMNIGIAIFGEAGKWWMGLVMIGASLGTLNAVLAGVPRILYGMSLTRQLPRPFGYLLPSTRAPAVGIIAMALIVVLMNQFDATTSTTFIELILAGVLGWATAYFLINVSLVSLRIREPNATRPYRTPLFPIPRSWRPACWRWQRSRSSPTRPRATTSTATSASSWQPPSRSRSSTTSSRSAACRRSSGPSRCTRSTARPTLISADLPPEVEPGGPHLPPRRHVARPT